MSYEFPMLLSNDYSMINVMKKNYSMNGCKNVDFADVLSKGVEKVGSSFEKMWKEKYPGAFYHVMDASKISQGVWERNDFPREKFFQKDVDESILQWKPNGIDPAMSDSKVQARLDSTLGKKAIVIPPELEEKMKNDPELANKVMKNVENFINTHPTRPGRICSYLISLNSEGEIAHFSVTGGGGNISRSSSGDEDDYFERMKKKAEKKREQEKRALDKREKDQKEIQRLYQKKYDDVIEKYNNNFMY